ncbi:MAG TPA: VRR-NUC domain-containing protein [Burkholderiaceae bacterium]
MQSPLDNPYYYLDNFHTVLDWVEQRYADLELDAERAFIAQFRTLPLPSRALLVRLVMRKGGLFRLSQLDYAEIGPAEDASKALIALGWLDPDPALDLAALFRLFRKAELETMFAQLDRADSKAAQLEQLLEDPELHTPRRLHEWHPPCTECVVQVAVAPLCERLRLLFFGNLHQDWTAFILSHLGIFQYEKVAFPASARAFQSHRDVDAYIALQRARDVFEAGEPLVLVMAQMPAPFANTWLQGRRAKLLFAVAQQYERCGELDSALAAYDLATYPGARARSIRVLELLERPDRALALAEQACAAPENDAELQQLARMLPRLRRKCGLPKIPAAPAPAPRRLDLHLAQPPEAYYVEDVVRAHLQAHDSAAPVYYVENALANSLFGLLCWEAVFAAVPGAFFHPFHSAPADLHYPDFYQRRKDLFDACLARLDSGTHHQAMRATYESKAGIASPFVFWGAVTPELLDLALACIPPAHLKKWCERILADVKAHRSGFPDLIRFWPAESRYEMIEVKGPGDRLQDNQLRWLDYCARHEMPVSVCYVQWTDP